MKIHRFTPATGVCLGEEVADNALMAQRIFELPSAATIDNAAASQPGNR
jgi:hypothetical protein